MVANKHFRTQNGQSKKNYTGKLATLGTQNITHHYTQEYTNNVNKTSALQQTLGGKDESNIVFMRKSLQTSQHGTKY